MTDVDGRTTRAKAQRQKRKSAILQAARLVFSERGYHATSISDIVASAGVARGTFYQYFDGKKSIFLQLLTSLIGELQHSIVGVDQRDNAPPLQQQLIGTVRRIFTVVDQNRSITTILFREAVGLDEDVDLLLKNFYADLQRYIVAALQVGELAGAVRPLNRDVVAHCIVGSMRQVAQHYLIDHPEYAFEPTAVAEQIVQLHLRGILSEPL